MADKGGDRAAAFSLRDHLFNADTLGQLAAEYAAGLPGFPAGAFLDRVRGSEAEMSALRSVVDGNTSLVLESDRASEAIASLWKDHEGELLAAVASPEGTGVLIASPSGLGKSSAALATMDCGCRFMSNDRVLVTLTPTSAYLVGVPKKPRINPGTVLALPSLRSLLSAEDLDAYSRMDRAELWNLESKLDADVEQLYGSGSLVLEAPLRLVFLLAWTPNSTAEPRFQEATEEEAVERLSQQLVPEGPYRQKPQPLPGKDTLRAMLRHVRTYVVTGGVNLGAFASFARQVSSEEQL